MQSKINLRLNSESRIDIKSSSPVSNINFNNKNLKDSQKQPKSFLLPASRLLRLLAIALPLGASLQAQASGPLMPVHFKVGGREVICKTTPLADDGETYVPLEALAALGLEAKPDGKGEVAHVSQLATRHSEDLALARPNGKPMLLLSDVARLVNGHIIRTEIIGRDNRPLVGSKGDTVYLLARIMDVRFQNSALRVTTSFPIPYHAHMVINVKNENVKNEKAVQGLVECVGAEVTFDFHPFSAASNAPSSNSSGSISSIGSIGSAGSTGAAGTTKNDRNPLAAARIHAQQYSIDTARVTLDLPAGITLKPLDKTNNSSAIIVADLAGIAKQVVRNGQKNRVDKTDNAPKVARGPISNPENSRNPGSSPDVGEHVSVPQPGSPIGNSTGNSTGITNSANVKSTAKSGASANDPNAQSSKNDSTAAIAVQTPTPPDDGADNPVVPEATPKKTRPAIANPGHTSLRSQSPSRGGNAKRALPIEINGLTLIPDTDTHVRLDIATTNAAGTFIHYLPGGKLAVDIPNAMLHLPEGTEADQTLSHPLLNGIHAELLQDTPPLTRITCDTARIVGFTVTNQSNNKISVDMRLPRSASGALADKVIVVDAGHGGSSTGATAGGFQEKNITLQISLKLRTPWKRVARKS